MIKDFNITFWGIVLLISSFLCIIRYTPSNTRYEYETVTVIEVKNDLYVQDRLTVLPDNEEDIIENRIVVPAKKGYRVGDELILLKRGSLIEVWLSDENKPHYENPIYNVLSHDEFTAYQKKVDGATETTTM